MTKNKKNKKNSIHKKITSGFLPAPHCLARVCCNISQNVDIKWSGWSGIWYEEARKFLFYILRKYTLLGRDFHADMHIFYTCMYYVNIKESSPCLMHFNVVQRLYEPQAHHVYSLDIYKFSQAEKHHWRMRRTYNNSTNS